MEQNITNSSDLKAYCEKVKKTIEELTLRVEALSRLLK